MINMNDQQNPEFPHPEDGWMFVVPPPARCEPAPLPYPLIVKGPVTKGQHSPDQMCWQCTITRYAVYSEDEETMAWVNSEGGDGLGAFGNGILVFDNLCTGSAGIYEYQVVLSLLDKQSGIIERHVVVRSEHFSLEMGFDNSSIQLTNKVKEEARKAIVESPIPERLKLLEKFRHYLRTSA